MLKVVKLVSNVKGVRVMEIKNALLSSDHAPDGSFIWVDFEARRLEFWRMVTHSADATDQELARLPAYNAFLHYGLKAYRTAGAKACRVLALALLQGHPQPSKAEAVLQRLWAGLLPEDALVQQLPLH